MSTFIYSIGPNTVISPFPSRTRTPLNPISDRTHYTNFKIQTPLLRRGNLGVARFGLNQVPTPDPENAELVIRDLFGRVEGFLYTIADAAVTSSDTVDAVGTTKQNSDWLSGITNAMEAVLKERIQLETARLYKLAGINPLAGCLPTLATIPIWIGLYRALSNVADEGLLTEGFFWIPSLSGPTTIAARQTGSGTSWLFPFIDGHPPLGWSDTLAYLVLPVLLVISQYVSIQIMQPPQQSNDPNVKTSQAITKLLPLMIGYFALSVPSGLSIYWFTNNILSTAQQVWLRKLGGAKSPIKKLSDDDIIIKKEKPRILESVSEAPIAAKVLDNKKDEKLTSEGPRPGERFKQLKEQEARKRKQREEEERKAVAELEEGITNREVDEESSSDISGFAVNGTSANSEENHETSDNHSNGRSSLRLEKNIDKD
ncbi:hypothetical protein MIMGU_mgv1a006893mg [Erythranthe guttata]|uniref:Membrane insertase YidC/Oxa/ALB C-terminal domain-containing protein n=1 Tax=Erythranthe guttata TaxID=4155 RepID=A0A022QRP8_ERYGU|nr:hypothetical protein MIMGU_mgv1a006893mg [Erythranthe guttata]